MDMSARHDAAKQAEEREAALHAAEEALSLVRELLGGRLQREVADSLRPAAHAEAVVRLARVLEPRLRTGVGAGIGGSLAAHDRVRAAVIDARTLLPERERAEPIVELALAIDAVYARYLAAPATGS